MRVMHLLRRPQPGREPALGPRAGSSKQSGSRVVALRRCSFCLEATVCSARGAHRWPTAATTRASPGGAKRAEVVAF